MRRVEELLADADALRQEEQYVEAVTLYNDALSVAEEVGYVMRDYDSAELSLKIAETALAAYGLDEATENYQRIIDTFAEDKITVARAHYELARAYMGEDEWQKALDELRLSRLYLWQEKPLTKAQGGPLWEEKVAISSLISLKQSKAKYYLDE